MKNVKLTFATALSVLAMTFTGTAFADGGDRQNNRKQVTITKVQTLKDLKRMVKKNADKPAKVERTVVKNTPNRKVIITKTVIKKPAPVRYVANKRFIQSAKYNQRAKYSKYHKPVRFVAPHRSAVYKVRAGDTLFRISLKTGVNLERLVKLNHLRGSLNYLQISQVLRLS